MQRQKSDGKKAEACVTVRCFRSGSVQRLSTSLARAHSNWCLCELLRPKKLSLWSLLTFPPSCFIWSLSSSAHDSSCLCVLLSVLFKLMCGWVGGCSYICSSSHALSPFAWRPWPHTKSTYQILDSLLQFYFTDYKRINSKLESTVTKLHRQLAETTIFKIKTSKPLWYRVPIILMLASLLGELLDWPCVWE